MLSSGNGNPEYCANNLLRIVQGEVPYKRTKGLNPAFVDMPADVAAMEAEISARWNLKYYEPRVSVRDIVISSEVEAHGGYNVTANVDIL